MEKTSLYPFVRRGEIVGEDDRGYRPVEVRKIAKTGERFVIDRVVNLIDLFPSQFVLANVLLLPLR